jgi:hypothetical protein
LFERCEIGHGSDFSAKGGWLWPRRGQNVKQKARHGRSILEAFPPWPHRICSMEQHPMSLKSRLAGLALWMSFGAAPGMAADCPAKSTEMDDIVVAIVAAPSCDAAMKVFEACEFGASGDVQLGAAVERKCQGDFLSRLKPPQKQAYQREMAVCDRKYRSQSGTMSLSFTAFCRAKVAQRHAQKTRK